MTVNHLTIEEFRDFYRGVELKPSRFRHLSECKRCAALADRIITTLEAKGVIPSDDEIRRICDEDKLPSQ